MREKILSILREFDYAVRYPEVATDAILATISEGCEPVYQLHTLTGRWIDQAEHSYKYNKLHGHEVRILYTAPPVVASEPVADLEEAQAKFAVLQEKYDNDCSSLELRVAATERDAARYRALIEQNDIYDSHGYYRRPAEWDAVADAAIAARKETK